MCTLYSLFMKDVWYCIVYTTMTAAYLQYCVLCFICSELKQINHKSPECDGPAELSRFGRYPRFFLSFLSLSPAVSLSSQSA